MCAECLTLLGKENNIKLNIRIINEILFKKKKTAIMIIKKETYL